MEKLSRATFKKKEIDSVPAKAKILSKDVTITVEEIENGFLVIKSTEVKYQAGDRTDYTYFTKKYYSKKNPLNIDMDAIGEKNLEDKF